MRWIFPSGYTKVKDGHKIIDLIRVDRGDTDHYRELDGEVANLGPDVEALSFERVRMWSEGFAEGCSLEPGGRMRARGPDGLWVDVVFDGPDFPGESFDAGSCDGCGELWRGATSIGPVCVDFEPLLRAYEGWGEAAP